MTDPFGNLAMQTKGDVGVFDGHQWQPSSQGQLGKGVKARFRSPGAVNIVSNISSGDLVEIVEGSLAKPVTTNGAALYVSREESLNGGGDSNAAVYGVTRNTGSTQPVGTMGVAIQGGSGDVCGIYGVGVQNGTGNTYGGFVNATWVAGAGTTVAGMNQVLEPPNVDDPYVPGGSGHLKAGVFMQLDAAGGATGGKRVGIGSLVYATTPSSVTWEVGYDVFLGAAHRAAYMDESSATATLEVLGTHTYIVNASAATVTGAGWHGGLTVDDLVTITRATGTFSELFVGTGTGAVNWGVAILSTSEFTISEVGASIKMQLSKGTPGANKTSLYISEGATPTLRQVTTFDPGAAGVNFTAGQLVLVAV